jgi:uncharacterized small protein (DUF1192 family)
VSNDLIERALIETTAERDEALNQLDSALHSVDVLEKRVEALLAERDALRAQLAKAHSERDAAIAAMSEAARKRGEAEGKLAASEMAGVVEGWRDRALKAEAALATARPDALREAAGCAENIRDCGGLDQDGVPYLDEDTHLHGAGIADSISQDILALIDTPTPSAPSPEAVARAALDGFPSDDDREWIDARADELFRSSERQRGGIRPATITPRDFRDFFVVNATAERIAAIIAKAGDGE